MQLYKARYLYPVSAPPIIDGVLVVDGERIEASGSEAEVTQRYPGARVMDLGEVMLLPQAVNAHTHLELTALAELGKVHLADRSFTRWIVELVKTRRTFSDDVLKEGARLGCRLLSESATAAVGDISNRHLSLEPLLESGLYGIIYYELIAPDPGNAAQSLLQGQEQIRRWRSDYGEERVRFGITLHTPYTVSAELFRITASWIVEENVPFCIHAAESPAEVEFLRRGTGEISEILYGPAVPAAAWMPPAGLTPIQYLHSLGVLKTRPLLVHGVQVNRDDLRLLAERGVPMAHCPRSNFLLNCGRMPIEVYQESGVMLAMGTDSLSSSPSLSIWDEAISAAGLHREAGVRLDPHELLRICTLDGARALGFDGLLGSLESGKLARLALGIPERTGENEVKGIPSAETMLQALWDGEVTVKAFDC